MKTVLGICRINAKQSGVSYLIAGIMVASAIVQYILQRCSVPTGGLPIGDCLFFLPLCMAVFIPALNLTKIMNLGGTRLDIFNGFILTYVGAVVATTLVSLLLYPLDKTMVLPGEPSLNLWDVFGFLQHGPVVGFFQMAAFWFLFACVLHTLTLSQGHWYGWVADVLIVAIISVFTPIAPLRAVLVWFFHLIIFNSSAIVQILACLIIGVVVYYASLVPIKTKAI